QAPDWGLTTWGIKPGEYERLHRFAVTQRDLFGSMRPMTGAPQAIRRLGTEGIRIRIITHRLFIRYFHETAVAQTVRWLDHHGIPYWDLCFMRKKGDVGADLYVEDSPENIGDLRAMGREVIVMSNPANGDVPEGFGGRAAGWAEAEDMIRARYYDWLGQRGLALPPGAGLAPGWSKAVGDQPVV
ncbi:MAG: 5' nucleotidase, NT5C type, partial [Acidimicrobiia bacterium]